ncbi:MAG: Rieske 2Fe-2S domain-containing protein [Halobacteriota archaeon]
MGADYVKVAETSEVPVGTMKEVEGAQILIANVNGNYYAISNKCSHMGTPFSQGVLDGNIVTCAKHRAQFDVTTGKVVTRPKVAFLHPKINDVPSCQLKVENENIMVKL